MHLVVLDVDLPGCSGLGCLETMRHANPQLAAIVISGVATGLEEPLAPGRRTRFLAKPFSTETFLPLIRETLATS